MSEFERKIKDLFEHFKEEGIDPSLYLTKWISTFFLYSFPFGIVFRLWDYIMGT